MPNKFFQKMRENKVERKVSYQKFIDDYFFRVTKDENIGEKFRYWENTERGVDTEHTYTSYDFMTLNHQKVYSKHRILNKGKFIRFITTYDFDEV
jgi:hypothetical protein